MNGRTMRRGCALVLVLAGLSTAVRSTRADESRELMGGYDIRFTVRVPGGWQDFGTSLSYEKRDGPTREFTLTRVFGNEKQTFPVKAVWSERAEVRVAFQSHSSGRTSPRPKSAAEWRSGYYDPSYTPPGRISHGDVSFGPHRGFGMAAVDGTRCGLLPESSMAFERFSGGNRSWSGIYLVMPGDYNVKIEANAFGGWGITEGAGPLGEATDEETAAIRAALDADADKYYEVLKDRAKRVVASVRFNVASSVRQVTGRVFVSAPRGEPAEGLALADVPVTLLEDGKPVARAVTGSDGRFQVTPNRSADLSLRVALEHAGTSPATFRITFDRQPKPVTMETAPFAVPAGKGDFAVDIPFAPATGVKADASYRKHLADLALTYVYAHQAHVEATVRLKQKLDSNLPLDIQTFDRLSTDPQWTGPHSDQPLDPTDPVVRLPVLDSTSARDLEADTVRHECGHAVMADAYWDLMPRDPRCKNHDGFRNPSTTDSWVEGFASFYACLVARDVAGEKQPHLFGDKWSVNIETNYRARAAGWNGETFFAHEEFAVAGLLWDLIDPRNKADLTQMRCDLATLDIMGIDLGTPPEPVDVVYYGDYIEMSPDALWKILAAEDQPDPPEIAEKQGITLIFDVAQLHAALAAAGVGKAKTPNKISALDELFIAHGFFADTNPQNLCWDPKEAGPPEKAAEVVGTTGNRPLTWHKMTVGDRPLRRSPPRRAGGYLDVTGRDAATGESVALRWFRVEALYDPPFDGLNDTFEAQADQEGRIHYVPADPFMPVRYRITPIGAAPGEAPLEVDNTAWWVWRGSKEDGGAFVEHEFVVDAEQVPEPVTEIDDDSASEPDDGGGAPILWILVILAAAAGVFVARRQATRNR